MTIKEINIRKESSMGNKDSEGCRVVGGFGGDKGNIGGGNSVVSKVLFSSGGYGGDNSDFVVVMVTEVLLFWLLLLGVVVLGVGAVGWNGTLGGGGRWVLSW